MKQLKDLTIREFELYQEKLNFKEPDMFGIFELFGLDGKGMPFDKFHQKWTEIQSMVLPTKGVYKHYTINGKRYKAHLNHLTLSAGQFIDFQSYMKEFNLAQVLSVFLIPQKKRFFKWVTLPYNDGYDMIKTQEDIRNHMTIGDANELNTFFLKKSNLSLETMGKFLEKREFKMRVKAMKQRQKDMLG